ncbi:hypothetical protein BLNAU_17891 [Blattamonas nauphoetae]|uniref:Uncharacterized protein n=1 Tax=Blattamonas nauphoetae TaxID=2049346 RepID=A0ABQ9XA81_9EUKA|nr:hypothetical protein BLNAU_17891 [Blattamonas nauphoetae]
MESQTLNIGTGPLLSFSLAQPSPHDFLASSTLQMNTFLQFCTFVNMSSQNKQPTFRSSNFRFGSNIEQKVIGCAISNSTNHQSGTTMMDPNFGGSLACLNTSFTSCVRTSNDEIDMKHKNVTDSDIGRTIMDKLSGMTSVAYTLCTFKDLTIAAGNSDGGSAIFIDQARCPVTITQCFFHNCTCTESNDDGGSICCRETRSDCAVSLTLSSFPECSAISDWNSYGGSVMFESNSSVSVTDCFFENSQALYDGALSIHYSSPATVFNCVFASCSSTHSAGAMGIYRMPLINLSSLQFRECSATGAVKASDLYCFFNSESIMTTDNVKLCDSTSDLPNVFNEASMADLSPLVPQLQFTPTATVSVLFSGETATVNVAASGEVNGTMSVLLAGSNVPRLVHVTFGAPGSPSTTGAAVVSSGANGILPLADYTLRSFSIPGFWFPPDTDPTVFEASLECTDDTCLYLVLKVRGTYLPKDSNSDFIVTLTSLSQSFLVKFVTSRTGQSDPILVTPSFDLDWGQEYTILSIVKDVPSDPLIVKSSNVMFTVPVPPHLTNARVECSTPLCLSVFLVFEGEKLKPDVTFITKISDTPLTLTTTFSSPTSGQTEPIDVWPSNPFPLSGFTIVSIEEANASPARQVNVVRLPTIVPEAIITGVNCTLDNTATTYTIRFNGVFISSSDLEMEMKDDANNTVRVQTFLKDGVLTATEVVYPTSPNNLIAGRTYTVVSSNNATINIRPLLSFTAPIPPRVLSASAECGNVMCSTMNIVLRGQAFLTNQTFLLVIDGITEPIPFMCETQTIATIGPLQIGGKSNLTYSTTYTLTLIVEDDFSDPHRIHCDGVTFTTPSSPRLSTVHTSSENGEDKLQCWRWRKRGRNWIVILVRQLEQLPSGHADICSQHRSVWTRYLSGC